MGVLSSSISLTRYRIAGEVTDELQGSILQRLMSHKFLEIDQNSDEKSSGWVCFDDLLDTWWKTAPPQKGTYLAFALRLDTRRIQPAVMKKHYRLALDEALKEQKARGHKFITRDHKKQIRDRVRQTLLSKTLPVPAVFDVAWNLDGHVVYLGTAAPKIRELFEDLFLKSFELHLEQQTPYFLARRLVQTIDRSRLDQLEAAVLA